eukprot:m.30420 g.30420  ORF g.30420 m.30420 type:complete len:59 (-) comp12228_c0_seq1:1064-1240(-)
MYSRAARGVELAIDGTQLINRGQLVAVRFLDYQQNEKNVSPTSERPPKGLNNDELHVS